MLISAVQQSDSVIHICIHIIFFIFFSIMVYHRILNIVPGVIQDFVVYPFYTCQFASANPKLPIFLLFFFLAVPHGMQDLSSPTSD